MQAWIKSRSRMRKDGRLVFITSVVFEAHVFDKLCKRVIRERHRSRIVSEAVDYVLERPGWVEATLLRITGEEEAAESTREVPSSNSRIHARGGVDGPATKRSPSSKPASRPAAPSKRGPKTPRK